QGYGHRGTRRDRGDHGYTSESRSHGRRDPRCAHAATRRLPAVRTSSHDAGVMAEVDLVGPHRVYLPQRAGPVATVGILTRPLAEVGLVRLSIDVGGVSRVSDHHRRAVVDVDEDALVANR